MNIESLFFSWQVVDFLQPYFVHLKCKQCRYKLIIKYTNFFCWIYISLIYFTFNSLPFAVFNIPKNLVYFAKLKKTIERCPFSNGFSCVKLHPHWHISCALRVMFRPQRKNLCPRGKRRAEMQAFLARRRVWNFPNFLTQDADDAFTSRKNRLGSQSQSSKFSGRGICDFPFIELVPL